MLQQRPTNFTNRVVPKHVQSGVKFYTGYIVASCYLIIQSSAENAVE